MDVPARNRPLVLLVAVVLAQVLLLAFQIKRGRDVRLIRVWSVELLTPLERAGTFTITKIESTWYDYIDLWHARQDNRELRNELSLLQIQNEELKGRAAEAARLGDLLGFRQANSSVPMIAAEVIGASADSSSRTVFINRGEHEGLRRNMPVITPKGIVGKISDVFPHTSQVLLISDKESGVGALFADSRTHGVINGTGEPQLAMDYVVNGEKVAIGEKILTSGEDRIFPKDLPVGTVASIKSGYPFQKITVQPAARLDRLEEVFVLLKQETLNPRSLGEESSGSEPAKLPAAEEKHPGSETESEKAARMAEAASARAKPGGVKDAVAKKTGAEKTAAENPGGLKTGKPASATAHSGSAQPAATNSSAPKPATPKPAAPKSAPAAKKPGGDAKNPAAGAKTPDAKTGPGSPH